MNSDLEESRAPAWARRWLWAAGAYNLTWGAITIAFPHLLFRLANIQPINYPEIWQCVGMMVGVYGIGYLIAASDSLRNADLLGLPLVQGRPVAENGEE